MLTVLAVAAPVSSQTAAEPNTPSLPRAEQLLCKLSAAEEYRTDEPIMVRFTLTNQSDKNSYILEWNTPLEGIRGNIFIVRRADGSELTYFGIMVSRTRPSADQYRRIKPGESVSAEVDLSTVYDFSEVFEKAAPGSYTVAFRSLVNDIATGRAGKRRLASKQQGELRRHSLDCSLVTFKVVPGASKRLPLIERDGKMVPRKPSELKGKPEPPRPGSGRRKCRQLLILFRYSGDLSAAHERPTHARRQRWLPDTGGSRYHDLSSHQLHRRRHQQCLLPEPVLELLLPGRPDRKHRVAGRRRHLHQRPGCFVADIIPFSQL
jgi:hypothetical protein